MHRYSVRVYYEDTDMAGIVYHANYLRYIERARSDWVRKLGNDQNAMRESGIVWVVRRIEADYLSSARFEDELLIETEVRKVTPARLIMDQVVTHDSKPVFKAVVTAVCMTARGQPVRLPAEIRALLT